MLKRPVIHVALVLFLLACTTTVNITLKNPTKETQAARMSIRAKGAVAEDINLGSVEPGSEVKATREVKRGRDLVLSTSARGYEAWQSSPTTITAKPDPREVNETIQLRAQLVDDETAIKTLSDAFSQLGTNYGLLPIQAKQAVETYLGALLVIVPPSAAGEEGRILHRVSPARFLAIVGDRAVTYAQTDTSHIVRISGSAAYALSAALYIIKFGATYSQETLYQLEWSLSGFGYVYVSEPPAWSLVKAIASLPAAEIAAISIAMAADPRAVVLYVNRFYAVRDGRLSRKTGKKLAANAKLDAGTFLSVSGAFTFDEAAEDTQRFAEAVLNIGGEVVQVALVRATSQPAGYNLWTPLGAWSLVGPRGSEALRDGWQVIDVRKEPVAISLTAEMVRARS